MHHIAFKEFSFVKRLIESDSMKNQKLQEFYTFCSVPVEYLWNKIVLEYDQMFLFILSI